MSETNMVVKHYKKISNFEADVQNAELYLIKGKNEIGKTSLLISIIEMIMGKSLTPEAIQRGREAGFGQFPATDKEGKPVMCTHSFKKDKDGKEVHDFKVIDSLGKIYSTPGKIKELLGVVTIMSIDDFYRNCQTAEGKRKIQKELIYKLLTDDLLKEVEDIDNSLVTESDLMKSILAIEKDLNTKNILLTDKKLTDEEVLLLDNIDTLNKIVAEKQLIIDTNKSWEDSNKDIAATKKITEASKLTAEESLAETTREYEAALQKLKDDYEAKKLRLENTIKIATEELAKIVVEEKPYTDEEVSVATTEVEEAKKHLLSVDVVTKKKEDIVTITKEIAPLQASLLAKTNEKAKKKERRLEILKSLNLSSITFDDNTFLIDDFAVKDTQVSKSKVGLVLAELLCQSKINENKIVYFGSMADFDRDRFKQLFKIFKRYNKCPLLEQISTENEPKLILTIDDVEF